MDFADLLALLGERGLEVVLDRRGEMVLRGDRSGVTEALRAVLQLRRKEVREWLDTRFSRRLVRGGVVVAQWEPGQRWELFEGVGGEGGLVMEWYGGGKWQEFARSGSGERTPPSGSES